MKGNIEILREFGVQVALTRLVESNHKTGGSRNMKVVRSSDLKRANLNQGQTSRGYTNLVRGRIRGGAGGGYIIIRGIGRIKRVGCQRHQRII